MSQENLLEMDDLSQGVPKPLPRPRPRSRIPKLSSSSSRKEKAVDDDSSGEGTSPRQGASPDRRGAFRTSKSKGSKGSFDNNAFVSDEVEKMGRSSPIQAGARMMVTHSPKRLRKQKTMFESDGSNVSDRLNDNIPSIGDNARTRTFDVEDDIDSNRSDATFTVENEKYQSPKVMKKPPIPKPKRKVPSDLPKSVRKSVRMESTSADEPLPTDDDGEPKPLKKKSTYTVLDIEPDKPKPGKSSEQSEKAEEADEADTASVSSAAAAAKQSVKSRFGKLFASSSSSESKAKKSSTETDKGKSAATSGEIPAAAAASKEKPSIVNRWKKTFSRSTSKPLQEEDEEAVGGEEKSEKAPEPPTPEPKQKQKDKKETRIFMPESHSEDENEPSLKSEGTSSKMGKAKKKEKLQREKSTEKQQQSDEEKDALVEEQSQPEKKSKFKPFAKLIVSKNKEKVKTEKVKAERSEPEKTETEPESGERKRTRRDKKEKEKPPLVKQPEAQKDKQDSGSEDDDEFSVSSSSGQEEEVDDEEGMKSFTESVGSRKEVKAEKESRESKSRSAKRKVSTKQREVVPHVDSASGKDLLFGVTVHSSDLLPLDPNVIHPVIKVSVMYQSGHYMKRTRREGDTSEEHLETRDKKKSKRRQQKENASWTEHLSDSVYSIMSQPCQARQSIPTFAPTWNELLVFEEPFKRFATPNEDKDAEKEPILFFEVMDFLPMSNNGNSVSITGFHGSEAGWYKVAWAFLKPIGANGIMNLNKKLRLQLFKPVKVRGKEKVPGPEVFSWWKSGQREKLNSTLYVTPKGILPPQSKSTSLRQLLSMRKEQLTQAILDSQLATAKNKEAKRKSLYDMREYANWTRMEGQSCKPPNKLVTSLPSSQIESLNIIISGNVYCTKFSPCGSMLAAGLDTDELHVILLFKVSSWSLLKTLKGHHGIIYEIAWKILELDDENAYHYIASASADSTVRIWSMKNFDEKTVTLTRILYHPSYVYTVKFHPTHPGLVASGCYDFIIRIWDVKPDHADADSKVGKRRKEGKFGCNTDTSPIVMLDQHSSFVNSLLFDATGSNLYSGDGASCIIKWSCMTPSKKKCWRVDKDVKLHPGNVPVNCMSLHPSGSRLLVHLRDNFLKILDVVTLIPLQTFSGLRNEKLQIRSCFSPCGNLVLSGSEDSTLCVWDADTGKILQLTSPQNHPHCVVSCVDYHPFDYYVAVGVSSTISEPSPILVYFYHQAKGMNYPMLKKTAMKMRQSLEKSRSQSSQSFDTTTDDMGKRVPAKRGDSTEKFVSIIQKLDTALYFAQQRNKQRQSEAQMSACVSAFQQQERKQESPSRKLAIGESPSESKSRVKKKNNAKEIQENLPPKPSHYTKRKPDRPRSASSIARAKRERYRKASELRDAKSDSEQTYLSKVQNSEENDNEEIQTAVTQIKNTNNNVTTVVSRESQDDGAPIQVISAPKPLKRRSISSSNENFINNNIF